LWIENMTGIDGDSAWIKGVSSAYRHYSGASISKDGRLWTARTVSGVPMSGHATAEAAISCLMHKDREFWTFGKFGPRIGTIDCGTVHHRIKPMGGEEEEVFAFCLPKDEQIPKFLKTIISKHLFGVASCVACLSPMSGFYLRSVVQFDWSSDERDTYLACGCGYAVWRMNMTFYEKAGRIIRKRAYDWHRTLSLRQAGGTHTREEMRIVLALQYGRCIYCNALFTDESHPSEDHLLPVSKGGSDWALNIVLACWRCNSRRTYIPFRTFCKLLSPTQNKRILANLKRRLLAIDIKSTQREALLSFEEGLAMHSPQIYSQLGTLDTRSARRNLETNRLLPSSAAAILESISEILD
jgi:5-methylcytosine-specific restriction endonuclease McrA